MVHHEAGHLLLLYYYGWQIGGFTCRYAAPDWMGSIRNRRIPDPPVIDTGLNLTAEAQKLLAGELAARIRLGLPTDRIVMPMKAPLAEDLTAQTPLEELYPQDDQRYDAIRVLGRYVHNRRHLAESWRARAKLFFSRRSRITWWTWMWDRHAEAWALLQAHWPIVEALAARLVTVNPNHIDVQTGHMVGHASGDVLLQWCNEVGAPILKADAVSVSY